MRIIIIDDDPIVSQSLKTILSQQDIDCVAIGQDGSEAVQLYQRYCPDIVLMDIRMKQLNGIEAGKILLQAFPEAKLVYLTTFQDDEYLTDALKIGAKGYLLKQDFEALALALHSVLAGQTVFGSNLIQKLHQRIPDKTAPLLSKREQDLMTLIAQGLNNKEIADALGYSEGTVRNQISALLDRLSLRDRTQLVIYYFNHLKSY